MNAVPLPAAAKQLPSRILVVDDDRHFRRLCREYLRDGHAAYDIDDAATAADAVEACRSGEFECVLIDYQLPDATGTELCETLKSLCPPFTPMIIITGIGNEERAIEAMHSGAADYLPKDRVSVVSLSRAINNAIEKARLLQSVEERNRRLEHANVSLNEHHEHIQRFYHSVSHEIKTPLAAAREFIALVADGIFGKISDEQMDALDCALESCDQIAEQLNELLESTRLDTGKLRLRKTLRPVGKLIEASVASVQAAFDYKRISVDRLIEPNLPSISVDGRRIVQVLANLLSNAEKFTDAGGRVTVFAYLSECRSSVILGVADTGCGITPQDLPRIFDRLYQAEATAESKSTRGLGLGLSIAREIVALHDGEISVESEPGRGATFRVRLPIDAAETKPTRPTPAPTSS